jgi:hypothetical protein
MTRQFLALLAAGLFSASACAQVTVSEAWVRATVPQQKATGAFMKLRSVQAARLVEVRTDAAGRSELHEMAMNGQMMRMRQVPGIALPAGQTVNLASGGFHVMLFDLKRQLKEGESVELTLVVEDAAKKRQELKVAAPVKPISYTAPSPAHAGH